MRRRVEFFVVEVQYEVRNESTSWISYPKKGVEATERNRHGERASATPIRFLRIARLC